jgi:putative membrane protein
MASTPTPESAPTLLLDSPSMELASNQTSMAYERTRMATDRTLMSIIRTSLSLIGFGFTIFKFFNEFGKQYAAADVTGAPARNFGLTLTLLGVGLLMAGIWNHYVTVLELRERRQRLFDAGRRQLPLSRVCYWFRACSWLLA